MPQSDGATPEIAAHADAALRAVRLVLGVLSCFVLGAYRPLSGRTSWGSLIGVLAAIISTVLVLNWISKHLPKRRAWSWAMQTLDVAACVALAVALDSPLGQQSWVLLVIPVVSAAVRHGSMASVLSWVGGCLGYLGAAYTGSVGVTDDVTVLARVPGVLLAVAVAVGLLARWMREGWEIQNALTATVAAREHRLAVIEKTGHALKDLPAHEALELCANQTLALGFSGATIEYLSGDQPLFGVGQRDIFARTTTEGQLPPAGPLVTVWVENDDVRVHSISVHEPRTHTMVTGWSRDAIDTDRAQALATLVSHTSTSIETSTLLRQLRHTAAHDALTGLANRRTLSNELGRLTREHGRLAVAFVDIDNFKSVNDRYGHDVGDKSLIAMARRLEAVVGSDGVIARYGGDEFVVLLPNAGIDDAQRVATAIVKSSAHPIAFGPLRLFIGVSVGIAVASTPIGPEDILRAADQAVYLAKAAGKAGIAAVDLDAAPIPSPRADQIAAPAT